MIKQFHYSICAHSHFQHLGDSTETLKKLADGTHPFSKKLNSAKERAAHKWEYGSSFMTSQENRRSLFIVFTSFAFLRE
jgi:hypothetical protein